MTLFIGPKAFTNVSQVRRLDPPSSTFEEERREVLGSVLQSLAMDAPDTDRTAACFHLLRHLTSPHGAPSR